MAARLDPLATPRGHLPARVYWIRRSVVLGLPLLLVVVLVSVFSGGGGSPAPQARLAGSAHRTPAVGAPSPRPSGPVAVTTAAPSAKATAGASPASSTPTAVPLASPDGPCAANEITVTPSADHARAGGPVTISVQLRTARPACTFAVSRSSLAVKITSGSDSIWSSQNCGGSVPRQTVVVRSAKPAVVPVTWNGRRITDGTCGATNAWARPGYYHALAAVIGSEPTDVQFSLSLPPRPVVTRTAHPKPRKTSTPKPGASKSSASRSSASKSSPSSSPTGGATGTGSACGGDNAAGTC